MNFRNLVLFALLILLVGCTEVEGKAFEIVDAKDIEIEEREVVEMDEVMEDNAYFAIEKLDEELKQKMLGLSFHENDSIGWDDLRVVHVMHLGFDGLDYEGSLIVNSVIAEEVLDIFKELYEGRYPIEKIKPVYLYEGDDDLSMADNNSSAFNFRVVAGTTRLSNHSYGLAIDINPLVNPYVTAKGVYPEGGKDYMERDPTVSGLIVEGDACYNAFVKRGYIWGGHWNSVKDYQHFEKKLKESINKNE